MIELSLLPIAAIESAINQYIALDPDAKMQLGRFNGKVMAVLGSDLPIQLYLFPSDQGIRVMHQYEGDVDATLKGSLLSLARLGLTKDPQQVRQLFGTDLSLEGDTEFGHEFKQFFNDIDIDWEEYLSKITGDVCAHQIGDWTRASCDASNELQDSLHQSLSEYLQEESRLFPPREEVEDFFNDIDHLSQDADRVSARWQRLMAQKGFSS